VIAELLARCTFPATGAAAVSGGADSTALLVLAVEAGCDVTAIHVDHGLRAGSAREADHVAALADRFGVPFQAVRVSVDRGANLEARARDARRSVLPVGAMTGHTADDRAETVLLQLLRGAGAHGLASLAPGPSKPILALRRDETRALCRALGVRWLEDPTNADPAFRRNRVRAELLPLLDDVAGRDVSPLLARTASLLEDDDALLDALAEAIDPTDARALVGAPAPLARRAVRRWLADGYPPDLATVDRVLAVARGDARATDVGGGRRVRRSSGHLILEP
jgi:tRNA(Ile)-lysidine synthase